jgi:hypothetical protein
MHSFHPSRSRILFEIFCAMTIAASFATGWTQTGAPAFLPAAAVCVLYSIVHAFDLNRRAPAATAAGHGADAPAELPAPAESAPAQAHEAEAKAPKPKRRSRKKAAAAEPIAPTVAEAEPAAEPVVLQAPEPEPEPEPMIVEITGVEPVTEGPEEFAEAPEPEPEAGMPPVDDPDEDYHAPIAPLFEPQPLVRQQRAVFGRKAG